MTLRNLVELFISCSQIVAGFFLFAYPAANKGKRFLLALLLLINYAVPAVGLAGAAHVAALTRFYQPDGTVGYATFLACYWMLVPLACAIVLTRGFGFSPTGAAFCAAMGYTLQNLTSALADVIEFVIGAGNVENVALLPTIAIELGVTAITYTMAWRLLARPISKNGFARNTDPKMLAMLAMVFLAVIFFDTVNKQLAFAGTDLGLLISLKVIHVIVCVFMMAMDFEILVNNNLRQANATATAMLAAERRQYELSRENIEAINIKCHDIRHQIRALADGGTVVDRAVIDDIARDIDVYDCQMHTGNDALDTILTEKTLICEREGIPLSCIADGSCLEFMAPTDIYSFFGNALDNAIEASRKVADREHRGISVCVRETLGIVSVHVENYYDGDVILAEDGLPATSKLDKTSHGFGTRSMSLVARRYAGTLVIRPERNTFHLAATFPIQ